MYQHERCVFVSGTTGMTGGSGDYDLSIVDVEIDLKTET